METALYEPLPMTRMRAGVAVQPPGACAPKPVRADSPAIEAMTDFRQVAAATIRATATLAHANESTIARGVFSATRIGRQLGVPLLAFELARTFAEIEAARAR